MTAVPKNLPALPTAAKKAEAAIQFFEDQGREVVGVTIKGSEFKLDFARPDEGADMDGVDLVTMGR